MPLTIPGTALPYNSDAGEDTYSIISPIIEATGGVSLSQLSSITGLEGSTIQNWIKRGWVTPSKGKKYGERSVVRILLINILRGALKLEYFVRLMEYVNGEVMDTDDDIMHDTPLYNLLCSIIYEAESKRLHTAEEISEAVANHVPDYITGKDKRILEDVLLIMVQSAMAGYYRSLAESEFSELGLRRRRKSEVI